MKEKWIYNPNWLNSEKEKWIYNPNWLNSEFNNAITHEHPDIRNQPATY